MHFYLVAPTVKAHTSGEFTYSSAKKLPIGSLVTIEIGKKKSVGVVVGTTTKPDFETKEVLQVIGEKTLPKQLILLANWMKDYYSSDSANVWQTILPRGIDKKRRPLVKNTELVKRKKTTFKLTADQKNAIKSVESSKTTTLLQGVTGSGKTAVYIELAKKTIEKENRSVIVLVPEIALTSQLVAEFSSHFSDVLLTHSRMSEAQRHIVWQKALVANKPQLVIGPRSALFMPLQDIGLIVIDEAHEPSFKQEKSPRYSALRAARVLASAYKSKLVLGSATPGVSDRYLAEKQNSVVIMPKPAKKIGQVSTLLVDATKRANFTGHRFFSNQLIDAIKEALARKEQVLLFHNRRGSASVTLCENCGWSAACTKCFVPLVLHSDIHRLVCHICGSKYSIPKTCPDCGDVNILHKGLGTKSIVEAVQKQFPSASVARFDGDSTSDETLDKLYDSVYKGDIDIIVGTQVVAKGLDLPKLSVVGVVQADGGLILPDFAAEERVFQLLLQVMGRVGRDEKLSKIIVQTFQPDHPAITTALSRDYDAFYSYTIKKRRHDKFPPFVYLLKLTCAYKTEKSAAEAAKKLKNVLQKHTNSSTEILGPSPAFYERAHGTYRWQIIVKSTHREELQQLLKHVPPTKWQSELDPTSLL